MVYLNNIIVIKPMGVSNLDYGLINSVGEVIMVQLTILDISEIGISDDSVYTINLNVVVSEVFIIN